MMIFKSKKIQIKINEKIRVNNHLKKGKHFQNMRKKRNYNQTQNHLNVLVGLLLTLKITNYLVYNKTEYIILLFRSTLYRD